LSDYDKYLRKFEHAKAFDAAMSVSNSVAFAIVQFTTVVCTSFPPLFSYA